MFRSKDHPQGATLSLLKSLFKTSFKTSMSAAAATEPGLYNESNQ